MVHGAFKHPGHCALSFSLPLQLLFFVAMSNYELVSQYTEDAFAKEDRLCQCPACGANIAKGDPCFYVATIEHGKPGRYVCGPCHERYQKKAATSVRPAGKSSSGTMSITNKHFQFALLQALPVVVVLASLVKALQIHMSFGSQ